MITLLKAVFSFVILLLVTIGRFVGAILKIIFKFLPAMLLLAGCAFFGGARLAVVQGVVVQSTVFTGFGILLVAAAIILFVMWISKSKSEKS